MNIERILLPTILLGISSLSLYSCRNGELRSSGNQNSNIADVADIAYSQDSHYNSYETSFMNGDELTSDDHFTLDSHLEGGDYDSILDLESKITPDSYFETKFRVPFDSYFSEEEENFPETTIETPPPFCIDEDGDGYGLNCILRSDCDDNDHSIHQILTCNYDGNVCGEYSLCIDMCPKLPSEKCDGIDNNCDGEIDEGYDVGGICNAIFGDDCLSNGQLKCLSDGSETYCDAENTFSLCPNQNGVCSGMGYCTNYKYLVDPCDPYYFSTVDSYEEIEQSCDQLDNNCDGVVDGNVDKWPFGGLIKYASCGDGGKGLQGLICHESTGGEWNSEGECTYDCIDLDGDGYGPGPNCLGEDCDVDNPFVHENCE